MTVTFILGATNTGKTTIANMLCKDYEKAESTYELMDDWEFPTPLQWKELNKKNVDYLVITAPNTEYVREKIEYVQIFYPNVFVITTNKLSQKD